MTATAAARLRAATRDPHDSLERSGFATALFAGTLPLTRCTARITAALSAGPTQAEASAPTGNVRPVATPGTHSRRTGHKPTYIQYEDLHPALPQPSAGGPPEHAPDAAP